LKILGSRPWEFEIGCDLKLWPKHEPGTAVRITNCLESGWSMIRRLMPARRFPDR
jgi:hypothetical protein